jgi:ABC-type transport system involved in multi-copper enzyme maturation permease subunit
MLENPVFIKELKTKMRSRQPLRVQAAIGALAALFVLYCYYQAIRALLRFGGSTAGTDGWNLSLGMLAVLVWILTPALTANAISQEKEQQTWEMLTFSMLSPGEIIFGKLAARSLPMVGLVIVFFPFMLLCFARSGTIGFGQFVATFLVIAVWIFFLTTVGIFMSWSFKRTSAALAMAYVVVFTLVIGTVLLNMTFSINQAWMESWIWWLNPIRITDALIHFDTDPLSKGVLSISSVTFLAIATFLLARMVVRFRAVSIE